MTTITGGIILKQVEMLVTFRMQCDKCGYQEPATHSLTLTRGVTEVSTMHCPMCGNHQVTKIKCVETPAIVE